MDFDVHVSVEMALREDIGTCDYTSMLIPADHVATASVIVRESAVLCGVPWFDRCFLELDPKAEIRWLVSEGDQLGPNQKLCDIRGRTRALLSAERTALNFLQALSATATATRRCVDEIAGTNCLICDTRKTLPGLRSAQKYAVRVGGGINHRMGLYDGVLIKENHIAAAGGIAQVLRDTEAIVPNNVFVQIEVENCDELKSAIAAGAHLILLDNFSLDQIREAVGINMGRATLEASGGITLKNLREVAETGVNRISIGSITKDIRAVDYSMRIVC